MYDFDEKYKSILTVCVCNDIYLISGLAMVLEDQGT